MTANGMPMGKVKVLDKVKVLVWLGKAGLGGAGLKPKVER